MMRNSEKISSRQGVLENNVRISTEEEARRLGLVIKNPQPPDAVCEFCGKQLHHIGYNVAGIIYFWCSEPERCTCDKAVKKWAEYDAKKEREKKESALKEIYNIEQRKIKKILGESGIGKRFQSRMFQTFKTDTQSRKYAYKVTKDYADNFDVHLEEGTGLYIEGTNGTGKTHLAAAIAMQLMTDRKIPCICKTAGDLLLDIKGAFDNNEVSEKQVLDIYKKVPLLIIDDLGKEQATDWSISTLYSIINERYERMLPIIITTNYNSNDLVKALTPKGYDDLKAVAIISRLREVSAVLTMAWKDARVKQ